MSEFGDGIHFTSEVFIVHKGRVLLHLHPKLGIWVSIGGHIEAGEDPNQAALREVKEETGLDVTLWEGRKHYHVNEETFHNLIPPVGLNRHFTSHGHEHVTFVFFATTESDAAVFEAGVKDWKWCSAKDLHDMELLPNIKEYASGALKELGAS